ncbi:hypothetical protein T09_11896 [Trichinella sp. T9]|nr:hypothetical protein T09_11896 [Trichinella sp. T9]
MVYDNENQHAQPCFTTKKRQLTSRKLNGCSNWCACCQHPAVLSFVMWWGPSVFDRYDLHPE